MSKPLFAPYRHWLLASYLVLLSACSLTPDVIPSGQQALIANGDIQHWQVSGKIGWRHGSNAESAYLNWSQCGDHYEIRLSGPLGQGAAKLYGNSQQAYLQTGDGQVLSAGSPEQLLFQKLGWSLPLSPLKFWLRGIPSPRFAFQPTPEGYDFQQQQWQLNFLRFTEVEEYQLPSKLKAQHLNPQQFSTGASPLIVTLIIKDWQLPKECQSRDTTQDKTNNPTQEPTPAL